MLMRICQPVWLPFASLPARPRARTPEARTMCDKAMIWR